MLLREVLSIETREKEKEEEEEAKKEESKTKKQNPPLLSRQTLMNWRLME